MIELLDGRFLRRLILALASAAVAVLLVTRYVAVPWVVAGPSMEPTLCPGDRVLVDVWTYGRRSPHEGEVALLIAPWGEPIVKRITEAPGVLPSSKEPLYRVLGDNRPDSTDSRAFGNVPRDRFRGRIVWRYWPLSRAGRIR